MKSKTVVKPTSKKFSVLYWMRHAHVFVKSTVMARTPEEAAYNCEDFAERNGAKVVNILPLSWS